MLHLLTGDDTYRLEQRIKALAATVDPLWHSFNYQETADLAAAIVQARTYPFGIGDRVTVCHTDLFNKKDEDALERLQAGVANLPEQSRLIFVAKKADARLKATKWLKKVGTIEDFPALTPWDTRGIEALVKEVAARLQLPPLQPAVLTALASAIGGDGYRLESELVKLSQLGAITLDSVRLVVDRRTQTALELADALVARNKGLALTLLRELQALDQHPLQIIATLIGRFEKLFTVLHAKGTDAEIAALAGVGNPKQVFYLQRDARSMGARLPPLLCLLLAAEVAIKSGADAAIELERVVVQC